MNCSALFVAEARKVVVAGRGQLKYQRKSQKRAACKLGFIFFGSSATTKREVFVKGNAHSRMFEKASTRPKKDSIGWVNELAKQAQIELTK
jgi:hypothetical protein